MNNCIHPDHEFRSQWKYINYDLESASGYCNLCGQTFIYDKELKTFQAGYMVVGKYFVPAKRIKFKQVSCESGHES